MKKNSEVKILLHSGVMGTLSALSLLSGAAKAQAEPQTSTGESAADSAEHVSFNVESIATRHSSVGVVPTVDETFSWPSPPVVTTLASDTYQHPAETVVPMQMTSPSVDFSVHSDNAWTVPSELDALPTPVSVVSPEPVGNAERAIAFNPEIPSSAELAAQANERLVTSVLEQAEVDQQTVFPKPDWDQPGGDLLITLASEDEEEEEDEKNSEQKAAELETPLLALNVDEDEEDAQRVNRRSDFLALANIADREQHTLAKAPWLVSSLSISEVESGETVPALTIPQVALRLSEDEREAEAAAEEARRQEAFWLALADESNENAAEDEQKSPWLAYSSPLLIDEALEEEDEEASNDFLSSLLLAANPATDIPKKRSADWVSLTPEELLVPGSSSVTDGNMVAIRPASPSSPAYDVNDLSLVAITPTYLASGEEAEVIVGASEVEFLSPESGAFLDIPSTSVVLRFPIGAKIALMANGQEVPNDLVGRTATDTATGQRTQTWYGVTLDPGENLLEVVSTETGEVLQNLSLVVRGAPESLVLLSPRSIPSDGRSTSDIRGHLVDADGNISLWNSVATLQASDGTFLGADYEPDVPGFQVQLQRGEFVAQLQSSLESHLVQLQAQVAGFEAFGQVQFVTPQRPELISGTVDLRFGARGTDFYDSYREFLPPDGDNSYELDVDAAVFATGNLGEWLYTGAYNSDRTLNENCQGESTLFAAGTGGTCNAYAIYGDDSSSDRTAPSLDSVYLRLERNSPSNNTGTDYALWGDFNTQEFATAAQVFTSTSRQLHGLKAHYNFGDLAATALYANNVSGFQRDTIAPDGTSGYYFTSERNIVPGSESVFLELEELERPGTVLERTPLSRGADYEIDYDRGTLLFSDPVARTSIDDFGQLLVRRIVTTYQHEDGSDTSILAGRLQYELNQQQGQESWIGSSYFTENQGDRDFSLYGADAQIAFGESARLTAEVAHSSSNFNNNDNVSGSAYRIELDGTVGGLTGRAHFRTTDAGFSNAATSSFVAGQTRYGAQLSGSIGKTTTIRAQYDHEDNFGTAPRIATDVSPLLGSFNTEAGVSLNNSLTTYSAGVSQRLGKVTAEVDWIHRDRTDRANNNLGDTSSDQLRSRLTYPITNRLNLVAQNELNLSSSVDPIYPSRTLIGLNWEATPWLNVGLNQVFYGGGGNDRGNATSLDFSGEHTFNSNTTVRGRFSTIDGRQIGGSVGLEQGINLAPGLNLDLAYEKVFNTFGNQTAASTQVSQSVTTGNNAASLGLSGGESYSIGLSYTDSADFQGSARFEHRNSSGGTNTVLNLSAVGRLSPSLSVLGDYRLANSASRGVTGLGSTSQLKLGLAYRDPADDRFNALLRYEHRMNPNALPTSASVGTSTETQEHLLAAEAIYTPNWRWELYGKYALRNSRTAVTIAGNDFSGNSTVQLAQARATYRLGYRWDVVGEARWISGGDYSETGYSLEAGYYPLPDLRLSAGYSGGATDSDFDNDRSAGGFYVGVTAKLGGLLSGFGTQPIAPLQAQESVVEVRHDTTPQPTLDLSSLRSDESAEARRSAEPPSVVFDLSALSSSSSVNEEFPNAVEL